MSLRRLIRNYATIQTSEGAVQTADGSFDRAGSWTEIEEFKNFQCHFQERSRDTVSQQFAKLDENSTILCYHLNRNLFNYLPDDAKNQTSLRIITNRSNHFIPLVFPVSNENDISIFQFKGHVQQIRGVRTKFYILRLERSDKWNK